MMESCRNFSPGPQNPSRVGSRPFSPSAERGAFVAFSENCPLTSSMKESPCLVGRVGHRHVAVFVRLILHDHSRLPRGGGGGVKKLFIFFPFSMHTTLTRIPDDYIKHVNNQKRVGRRMTDMRTHDVLGSGFVPASAWAAVYLHNKMFDGCFQFVFLLLRFFSY